MDGLPFPIMLIRASVELFEAMEEVKVRGSVCPPF
jgi:hypothetical protein